MPVTLVIVDPPRVVASVFAKQDCYRGWEVPLYSRECLRGNKSHFSLKTKNEGRGYEV